MKWKDFENKDFKLNGYLPFKKILETLFYNSSHTDYNCKAILYYNMTDTDYNKLPLEIEIDGYMFYKVSPCMIDGVKDCSRERKFIEI